MIYLGKLKYSVRDKSRPKLSVAEWYVVEECLIFCSLNLANYMETKFSEVCRNEDNNENIITRLDVFTAPGCWLGKAHLPIG